MQNSEGGLSGETILPNNYSERELAKVRLPSNFDVVLLSEGVPQLLKAAQTNLASLMRLAKVSRYVSDKDQTSCLEVFLPPPSGTR